MSKRALFAFLVIVFYVVVWLLVMPLLAEVSARVAVLGLAGLTALFCFVVAHVRHRNKVLWTIFGAIAGFFELGLIVVVLVSTLPTRNHWRPASINGG